jgi:hypothetical protein
VSTDYAANQTFMAKMIKPALFAISLAGGIDQGQIAWLCDRWDVLLLFQEMKRLDRYSNFFGETDADKTTRRDRVTIAYEANRFLCANDLPALQRSEG